MAFITVDAQDIKTGKVVEALIENTVPIGGTFTEGGRTLRRLPSSPRSIIKGGHDFLAWNLPFKDEVEERGLTPAEHYTKDGVAAFSTAKGRDEYAAKHNDNPSNGTQLDWDR